MARLRQRAAEEAAQRRAEAEAAALREAEEEAAKKAVGMYQFWIQKR